jgi:hypothetical protein
MPSKTDACTSRLPNTVSLAPTQIANIYTRCGCTGHPSAAANSTSYSGAAYTSGSSRTVSTSASSCEPAGRPLRCRRASRSRAAALRVPARAARDPGGGAGAARVAVVRAAGGRSREVRRRAVGGADDALAPLDFRFGGRREP